MGTLVVLNDFPMRSLLHKIAGNNEISHEIEGRMDDIPTHIAVSNTKKFSTGINSAKSDRKRVTLTMIHNPSHLESQNAISMGKTRAKLNDMRETDDTRKVLNIQVHGDAAFSGQGAAYESLTLCNLPKFTIGGSIHIITNNQIGFTTLEEDGRSTPYSSDIVKGFSIPVIRLNAADAATTAESVLRVAKFMVKYWKTFRKDILVDMIGFRKHGHNEVDEPAFTQPAMYQNIKSFKKTFPESYADLLIG
jgi:2-oxoglutarate dehydrogenase complex dehydrogenase (E1) component-like enzyme